MLDLASSFDAAGGGLEQQLENSRLKSRQQLLRDKIAGLELEPPADITSTDSISVAPDGSASALPRGKFHVAFCVHHAIFSVGEDTSLYFSLFRADDSVPEGGHYVSDEFVVNVTKEGLSASRKKNVCIFRNVTASDFSNLFLVCRIFRTGVLKLGDTKRGADAPPVRRPYGACMLKLSDSSLVSQLAASVDANDWVEPETALILVPFEESKFNFMPALINRFVYANDKSAPIEQAPHSIGIASALKLITCLPDAPCEDGVLDAATPICDLFALDRSVMSGVTREDVFLNLVAGDFLQGRKKSAKNVQVRVHLRDMRTGANIRGAFSRGTGPMAQSEDAFESFVLYHTNSPQWQERLHMRLPSDFDSVHACVLYFEVMHRSSKDKTSPEPFAVAWLPVIDRNTGALQACRDLAVPCYKPKSEVVQNFGRPDAESLLEKSLTKQRLHVRLEVCSTGMTADPDLFQLAQWLSKGSWKQTAGGAVQTPIGVVEQMKSTLRNIQKKPNDLVMHMFPTVLDALLAMLVSCEQLRMPAFEVLVGIFADLNTTAKEWAVCFDLYEEARLQEWPAVGVKAYDSFVELLQWLLSHVVTDATTDGTDGGVSAVSTVSVMRDPRFATIKKMSRSLGHFFRVLCHNSSGKEDQERVEHCFELLNQAMRLQEKWALPLHGFILQDFPATVDVLQAARTPSAPLLTPSGLCRLVCAFLDSTTSTNHQINLHKLHVMRAFWLRSSELDTVIETLPAFARHLHQHTRGDSTLEERLIALSIAKMALLLINDGDLQARFLSQKQHEPLEVQLWQLLFVLLRVHASLPGGDLTRSLETLARFDGRLARSARGRIVPVLTASQVPPEQTQVCLQREVVTMLCDIMDLLQPRVSDGVTGGGATDTTDGASDGATDSEEQLIPHVRATSRMAEALLEMEQQLGRAEVLSLFTQAFRLLRRMVADSSFPVEWVGLRVSELLLAVRLLRWSRPVMCQRFDLKEASARTAAEAEATDALWCAAFEMSFGLLTHELHIKQSKLSAMLTSLERMQHAVAEDLMRLWLRADTLQPRFISAFMQSAIRVTVSAVPRVADCGKRMYCQMLAQEWRQSGSIQKTLDKTIDSLDVLSSMYGSKRRIVQGYKHFFKHEVLVFVEAAHKGLGDVRVIRSFISDTNDLFNHLVDLKSLPRRPEYETERTEAALRLINYAEVSNKPALRERYIVYLADLHKSLQNHVERGLALLKHASLYGFDPSKVVPSLTFLSESSDLVRSETLLQMAMECFDAATCYEKSIKICKELAARYERQLFDLTDLSKVLHQQAEYWTRIAKEDRIFPEYFLVSFYGSECDEDVRGRQFVCKSGVGASVKDFTDEIRHKYVGAQVANSTTCATEVREPSYDGHFILITKLSTVPRDLSSYAGDTSVSVESLPGRMRKYYEYNEVARFVYTYVSKDKQAAAEQRLLRAGLECDNEFQKRWVDKVFVTSEEAFPCLRRRVPVQSLEVQTLNPVQHAVATLEEKVAGLRREMRRTRESAVGQDTVDCGPLSMQLNGIADAAVSGGIANYRAAFYAADDTEAKSYFDVFPEQLPDRARLNETLVAMMQVLGEGLELFSELCDEDLRPLCAHLESASAKLRQMVSEMNCAGNEDSEN